MKLTIEDLRNPEMTWKNMGDSSIDYLDGVIPFTEWTKKLGNIQYYQMGDYLMSYFSRISQKTGITTIDIKNYYMEVYPQFGIFFSNKERSYKFYSSDFEMVNSAFRVPDVDEYIKKMSYKSPERKIKEELLVHWHECSLEEQELVLCMFAGLLGVGSNNRIEREWKKMMSYEEIDCINNSFQEISESIKPLLDENAKKKATDMLLRLNVRELSMQSLYEIIEHIEKDYKRKITRNQESVITEQSDSMFEEIILVLKTILNFQIKCNLDNQIREQQAKSERANSDGKNCLAELQQIRFLKNPENFLLETKADGVEGH